MNPITKGSNINMTATNLVSTTNTGARLPIATLTFHLNTSMFKMNNGKLVKCEDEKIVIGEMYPLLEIKDDIAELSEGRFVKGIEHQNPTIHYGILEIIGDKVNVCSRNGSILRKVIKGQKFKIKDIISHRDKNIKRYAIGKNEYISSKEPVHVITGYLVIKNNKTLVIDGKPLILEARKPYPFSEVYGMQVLLTDFENTWVDVEGVDFTINHMDA